MAKKYFENIKNPYKKANIENLIKQFSLIDALCCVWTCKDDLTILANDEEHAKLKRNEMIAIMLKKLIESGKIIPNSVIRIYLDEMQTEKIQEISAVQLQAYLNKDYSKNPIIRYLWFKKLTIHSVLHLDSKKSNCIQAADISVNFSNKHLNKYPNSKKLFDLFKNFDINISGCKFPKIVYNECIEKEQCCWSESSW